MAQRPRLEGAVFRDGARMLPDVVRFRGVTGGAPAGGCRSGGMTRVATPVTEPIRPAMGGVGVRYLELATRLPAAGFDIVLPRPASVDQAAACGAHPGSVRPFDAAPRRRAVRRPRGASWRRATRQRRRAWACPPRRGRRSLRPVAGRELPLPRDARSRPVPQRSRDLGAADVDWAIFSSARRTSTPLLSRTS